MCILVGYSFYVFYAVKSFRALRLSAVTGEKSEFLLHFATFPVIPTFQASPGKPISAERLKKECTVALPFARMQGLPPPPTGAVSKGMIARTGDNAIPFENVRPGDPYAMSAQERLKYERLFPVYDTDGDGFLTGPETVDLFSKSGLPREVIFSCNTRLYQCN